MEPIIKLKKFSEINLSDAFFDSLKTDYSEFALWFNKKASEGKEAYLMEDNLGKIQAFLFLKQETEEVTDVIPKMTKQKRIKVGTLKINPHGTKLGERFIKKVFDYATTQNVTEIYVTVFEKHNALIALFEKYGFVKFGIKNTNNGQELVYLKNMKNIRGDIYLDYPAFHVKARNKFLLAIFPKYHTGLFPDSILDNESFDIIKDVSHTNSIHKIYICHNMNTTSLKKGDILVIYRTTDREGQANYRSVITSVCIVEEVRTPNLFGDKNEFISYCEPHSVFTNSELEQKWGTAFVTIKMTYNAALTKRLIRLHLGNEVGLDKNLRWDFIPLSDDQFQKIINLGGVYANLIINQT